MWLCFLFLFLQTDSIVIRHLATLPAETENALNFGIGGIALLSHDAQYIYYADNSFGFIRVLDLTGKEIKRIGNRGNGPGEFQEVYSMVLSREGSELFVLDYQNARIVVFDVDTGKYLSTSIIKFPSYFITALQVLNDEFILIGAQPENDAFFHRFRKDGSKTGAFGSLLNFNSMPPGIILAKEQLTQGFLLPLDNGYVGISQAPYIRTQYNQEFEQIASVSDPVIPDPWVSHMRITNAEYYVGLYPRVAYASLIDPELILVSIVWPDDQKHVVQLVNAQSLQEELRLELSGYNLLKDVKKVSSHSYYVLFVDPDTLDMELQEWTITNKQ